MTGDQHSSIVAFSTKITIEQAGNQTRVSPGQARVVLVIPVSFYAVRMHHQ